MARIAFVVALLCLPAQASAGTTLDGTPGPDVFELGTAPGLVTLNGTTFSGIVAIDGLGGQDTVIGTPGIERIQVTGTGAGSVAGLDFADIEAVQGGPGDVLLLSAGAVVESDGVDVSTATITFTGLELVDGDGSATLRGSPSADAFEVVDPDTVVQGRVSFTGLALVEGGDGPDTYLFSPGARLGGIVDFSGEDALDLRAMFLGWPPLSPGDDPFALGMARARPSGPDLILDVAATPSTQFAETVHLFGLIDLTPDPVDPGIIVTEAPVLAVGGTCPGQVTVAVEGATPGGTVFVVSSASAGAVAVPVGPCAGTPLGLAAPVRVRARRTASGAGAVSVIATLPPALCGQHLQVLDVASCLPSTVEVLP